MSDEAATQEFSAEAEAFVSSLMGKTLKELVEIRDCLKAHGVEPAAGGAVMMAPSGGEGGEAAVAEPTEFDVVMTGFGDKKLDVVKIVKALTGASLMEAKKLVEAAPATIKEKVSKEEAEKVKEELEKAGASVELKA
jgi:large subunit ribosomal protein L7/L12